MDVNAETCSGPDVSDVDLDGNGRLCRRIGGGAASQRFRVAPTGCAMKRSIIFASTNAHKYRELEWLLGEGPWRLVPLDAALVKIMPPEEGTSFAENACGKAEAVAQHLGSWALADDSGLVVDALQGAPGVVSARYAGLAQDATANNLRVLCDLINVGPAERAARFVCVLALARPEAITRVIEGQCCGMIAMMPRGTGGFGYDPLLYLPERQCTMAELPPAEKNRLSHRARAAEKMREILLEICA